MAQPVLESALHALSKVSGVADLSLGLDFGTNSVRALIVETATGEERATAVAEYPGGDQGVWLDASDPHLARQHPQAWLDAMASAVRAAAKQVDANETTRATFLSPPTCKISRQWPGYGRTTPPMQRPQR
jgi:hypothetical protein